MPQKMSHSDVDTFRVSVGSTRKRPISKRSFPFRNVLILYISQESQDDCLHVDFEYFKLGRWPTLTDAYELCVKVNLSVKLINLAENA